MDGEPDIATVAAVIADPGRGRMLMALIDGRGLAASVLADEAGVAASTASAHLARLVESGLVDAERQGRHRYFSLAGPEVARLLESMAQLAPPEPVRSLRQGTRAEAVRSARTCYDHLAGQLGTALMESLLADGTLTGGDGLHHPGQHDRLSAPGSDVDYAVSGRGRERLAAFGLDMDDVEGRRRPTVRYCVDWSEQRHHLAGGLGAALCSRLFDLGWVRRASTHRAVRVTEEGTEGLGREFGLPASG